MHFLSPLVLPTPSPPNFFPEPVHTQSISAESVSVDNQTSDVVLDERVDTEEFVKGM